MGQTALAVSAHSGDIDGMKVLTRFVTSAAEPRQFPPPGAPEIAFIGRSNVGKSSLINSLAGSKIAKTSNTPGRTQTINFFQVRRPGRPQPDLVFADLPGYGYARVPKAITSQWAEFINPYLEKRESLALCLCLVDVTIPPQDLDLQLLDWLRHMGRNFLIVATKADRISGNQRRASMLKLAERLGVADGQIVPFSAKSQIGHDELWAAIKSAAGVEAPGSRAGERTG
jgi:GTP-binding protein